MISLSSSGMQHVLDICDTYANSRQLSYNATKSFSLCIRPKQIKINPPSFVSGKQISPTVDKCKYLGIVVRETNCDDDLKRQMRKYYANAIVLLPKFCYCSLGVKCCCLNLTVPQCIVLLCGLIVSVSVSVVLAVALLKEHLYSVRLVALILMGVSTYTLID